MLVMNDMQALGALIEDRMKMRGLAAYELAQRLGRQPSFVSRLLNGQNANLPDAAVLREIGATVGLSMAQMLRAAGYLEDEPEGDVMTVPADDPRAELVRLTDDLSDEAVAILVATLRPQLPLYRQHRMSGTGRQAS